MTKFIAIRPCHVRELFLIGNKYTRTEWRELRHIRIRVSGRKRGAVPDHVLATGWWMQGVWDQHRNAMQRHREWRYMDRAYFSIRKRCGTYAPADDTISLVPRRERKWRAEEGVFKERPLPERLALGPAPATSAHHPRRVEWDLRYSWRWQPSTAATQRSFESWGWSD